MHARTLTLTLRSLLLIAPFVTLVPNSASADIIFDTGSVAGTVTQDDGTTQSPLIEVQVTLNALDGSGQLYTQTDINGDYNFEAPVGDYELVVYYPQPWKVIDAPRTVSIEKNVTKTEDFEQELGYVSGTVLRTNLDPVPGAFVDMRLDQAGNTGLSVDGSGNFSGWLPEGNYNVEGIYSGFRVDTDTVTITQGFPESVSLSFASSEVNWTVTADGLPQQGARIRVQEAGWVGACPTEPECEEGMVDPEGNYCDNCFDDVEQRYFGCTDGDCYWQDPFHLFVQSDGSGAASWLVPEMDVQITTTSPWDDMSSIQVKAVQNFSSTDGATLNHDIVYETGTFADVVTIDGATPLQDAQVYVQRIDLPGSGHTTTDGSGAFSFELPSGSYEVQVFHENDWLGPFPVTVDPAATSDAGTPLDFAATVDPLGTLRGEVLRDGVPAEGVYVRAMEDNSGAPDQCPPEPECEEGMVDPEGNYCDNCWDATEERYFYCDTGQCWWQDPKQGSAYVGPDGLWQLDLEPATYDLRVQDWSNNQGGESDYSYNPEVYPDVVVTDGSDQLLATHAFNLGVYGGQLLACGIEEEQGWVHLSAADGSAYGYGSTAADGTFSIIAPTGDYQASLTYPFEWFDAGTVSIPGSLPAAHDFVDGHGTIEGSVYKNGAPAVGAVLELHEPSPTGCDMPGAICWEDNGDWCECEVDGRGFYCENWDPENLYCEWYGQGGTATATDETGRFSARIQPGEYLVEAYFDSPQQGRIHVGTVFARAFLCDVTEIGASGASVAAGTDVTVDLAGDVTATFDTVGNGTVSYVATSEIQGGEAPPGLIDFVGLFYDFSTDAEFGTAELCLPLPGGLTCAVDDPRMLHWDDELATPAWVDVTTSCDDTTNFEVCGLADHFSWFVEAVLEQETDVDGDGILDEDDNCPDNENAAQADFDGDGAGDACDPDQDDDLVLNDDDGCASTPTSDAIDDDGCSSAQRLDRACPAAGNYKNHGSYVSCVTHEAQAQVGMGLIDSATKSDIVSAAAQSAVGRKNN